MCVFIWVEEFNPGPRRHSQYILYAGYQKDIKYYRPWEAWSVVVYVIDRPQGSFSIHVIYARCYEAEPSNPKGITYTIASEGSM